MSEINSSSRRQRLLRKLDPSKIGQDDNSINYNYKQVGVNLRSNNKTSYFGVTVAINGAGDRIAVGSQSKSGFNGDVHIYQFNTTSTTIESMWYPLGSHIIGNQQGQFGSSIDMSDDGNLLIIGAPYRYDNVGSVSVYRFDYEIVDWVLHGSEIRGRLWGGFAGRHVSISGDGNHIAYGSPPHSTHSLGHVLIYSWNRGDNDWTLSAKSGVTFEGINEPLLGAAVSLNYKGDRIVIGADVSTPEISGVSYEHAGGVMIYEKRGDIWKQVGETLHGNKLFGRFGLSVDIAHNGKKIVVSGTGDDFGTGKLYVYEEDTSNSVGWTLLGGEITSNNEEFKLGGDVSISGMGDVVAVGAYKAEKRPDAVALAFLYDKVGDKWKHINFREGNFVPGTKLVSVGLDKFGDHIVVGSTVPDKDTGHVQAFYAFLPTNDELYASDVVGIAMGILFVLACSMLLVIRRRSMSKMQKDQEILMESMGQPSGENFAHNVVYKDRPNYVDSSNERENISDAVDDIISTLNRTSTKSNSQVHPNSFPNLLQVPIDPPRTQLELATLDNTSEVISDMKNNDISDLHRTRIDSSTQFKPTESQNITNANQDQKQTHLTANPLNMQVEFGGDWNEDFDTDDNHSIISYETWNHQGQDITHSIRDTSLQGNHLSYSMEDLSLADTTVNTFAQSTRSHNPIQQVNLRGKYPPRTNKYPTGYLGQNNRAKEALGLSDDLSLADTTVNTFAQSTRSHNPLQQVNLRGKYPPRTNKYPIGYLGRNNRAKEALGLSDDLSLADTTVNTFAQSMRSHNPIQQVNLRGKYPPRTNKYPTGYLGQNNRAKEALGLSDDLSLADTTVNTFAQSTRSHNPLQQIETRARAKISLGNTKILNSPKEGGSPAGGDRGRFRDQQLSQDSLKGEAAITQSEDAASEESDKKIV
ncbi:hypothetical protein CTEN210_14250 [Chaetoceros tenuissimus]|uniref:Uncharacterized protein n=1 Tax=Chaetoceros tenuissimus TaxID=426638 RepID=A0AAD3D4U4_9STRA|nr:hypothetical protein CTEN210_14250 [Chaetoceros tenuissimus]